MLYIIQTESTQILDLFYLSSVSKCLTHWICPLWFSHDILPFLVCDNVNQSYLVISLRSLNSTAMGFICVVFVANEECILLCIYDVLSIKQCSMQYQNIKITCQMNSNLPITLSLIVAIFWIVPFAFCYNVLLHWNIVQCLPLQYVNLHVSDPCELCPPGNLRLSHQYQSQK